jgi:hypothetical protein
MSESNLDAKGRLIYPLLENYAFHRAFRLRRNCWSLCNLNGNSPHSQHNRAKHAAEQGVPFRPLVRPVGAIGFGYQLRERLDRWVPQDGLDFHVHYGFALCHLDDFLVAAIAQLKNPIKRLYAVKTISLSRITVDNRRYHSST